ncbi:MAG: polysaccharide deacetylase family protein [Clostridia bacterium]|nr:polysaccharide deacetylase family protein [Clostridia bacterium]
MKGLSIFFAALIAFFINSFVKLPEEPSVQTTGKKYFTLSFDDGITQDYKIMEICRKHNFKGITFNINSGLCGKNWDWVGDAIGKPGTAHQRLTKKEIKSGAYDGFDIAVHGCKHSSLKNYDNDPLGLWFEIEKDALNIKAMTGNYPVGMAYAGGDTEYTEESIENLRKYTTIKYARCTTSTYGFDFPTDYLKWQPTCGILDPNLFELAEKFLEDDGENKLFYVWGHGYELDAFEKYDELEKLIEMMNEAEDVVCVSNTDFYLLNQ